MAVLEPVKPTKKDTNKKKTEEFKQEAELLGATESMAPVKSEGPSDVASV